MANGKERGKYIIAIFSYEAIKGDNRHKFIRQRLDKNRVGKRQREENTLWCVES